MPTTLETLRNNQNLQTNQQMQAANFEGNQPAEVANGIPSNGNDAALAAHLKQTRDTSAEYAKLRTEEARQQWEQLSTANFLRDKANQDAIKNQAAIETMNRAVRERAEGERLFSEFTAVSKDIPADATEWTLPMDTLKDLASTTQKLHRLTGVDILNPEQQAALPQGKITPDNAGKVTQNPDGSWTVEYVTGEKFTGDAKTVIERQMSGAVNTKRWAQQRAQAAVQQQPAQPQPQPAQQSTGSLAGDLAAQQVAQQAEALAQHFGFSNTAEMVADYQSISQFRDQYNDQMVAMEFMARCPEFPETEQANESLINICDSMGWNLNADNMQAAHLLAVKNGAYQPLTQDQIRAASGEAPRSNRQTPPPMLHGGNPEMTVQTPDPYTMPMHELRKAAIAQELQRGGGQNYR